MGGGKDASKYCIEHLWRYTLHCAIGLGATTPLPSQYDAGVTPEAALVKQIDKLEMCVQALEYEQDCGMAPVPGHALVRLPPAAERSPESRTDSGPKRGRSTDSEQPSPSGS